LATFKENIFALHELSATIKLRLNRREDEHKAVQETLEAHDAVFKIAAGSKLPDPIAVFDIENKLVAATQVVLKDAWKTVRDGEPTYRVAKRASIMAIACASLALVSLGTFVIWKRVHP
jgi:hypothetical protein